MGSGRWRIELMEEAETLPVPWRPPERRKAQVPVVSDLALVVLLKAFDLLTHRGAGALPWAAPLRDDPIAFLLDTMGDAISLRGAQGELLYQNRAAAELGIGRRDVAPLEAFAARGRRFERRCLSCCSRGGEYVLEIIREVG